MDLSVKYKELEKVVNSINNRAISLDKQIELLESNVEKLKDNWNGYDADTFYNSINPFLDELKQIPVFYKGIATIANNMNKNYQTVEQNYSEELKKSVVQHEQ